MDSDSFLTKPDSRPVLYDLIDKYGQVDGTYATAAEAEFWAKHLWPDQEQDEDRTGKGWSVRETGSDK